MVGELLELLSACDRLEFHLRRDLPRDPIAIVAIQGETRTTQFVATDALRDDGLIAYAMRTLQQRICAPAGSDGEK